MPIATGLALGIAAASAAGSLGGAALSSNAAGNAASTQANASKDAAQLQYQAGQNALGFQEGQYNNTLGMEMPFYNAGLSGLTNLENLMGILPASASTTAIPHPQSLNVGMPTPQGMNVGGSTLPNTSQLMNAGHAPAVNPGTPSPSGMQPPAAAQRTAMMGFPGQSGVNPPMGNNGQPVSFNPNGSPVGSPAATANFSGTRTPGVSGTPPPNSLTSLINPQLGASGSLMTPFLTPFQAPTGATESNDPGYQFRLNQGMQALQNSAAAKGDLLSGNFAQGAEQFGQDYASNEYGNVYNRALQQYQLAQNNSTNIFNQLASISGLGQTSLQQIANTGTAAGGQVGSTLSNTAALMGQDYQNAGAATASGYVGQANAYGGAINNASQLAMLPYLSQLMNPTQYNSSATTIG